MKQPSSICASTSFAVVCLAIPVLAFAAEVQPDRIARIEANLQPRVQVRGRAVTPHTLAQEMATHHAPAISVAVVDHGRIIWTKAYGLADVARKRPATPRTLFQAGSISKPVAASAAMQLVQEGRLVLDAPANGQLSSWQIPDNAFTKDSPVTLRHLLTHTGGLTVHGFPGYAAGDPLPTVVQVLEGKPPADTEAVVVERRPGTQWSYSGGGITIVQLMMTEATHQSFPELMRQRVLGPMGMADSTYEQPLPPERETDAATAYLSEGQPLVIGRFNIYPEMAAAGLWTTPTDLAKWAIGLEEAYDGASSSLMSHASAKSMLTPGLGHWGLGVEVGGAGDDFHFNHSGSDRGFKADLMAWPKGGRAVIVMGSGEDSGAVVFELMQAVAHEYGWKGIEPRIVDPVKLSEAEIKDILGSYGHGLLVISAKDGALSLTYGGSQVELLPTGHDQFLADPDGARTSTQMGRGTNGQVETLTRAGTEFPRDH